MYVDCRMTSILSIEAKKKKSVKTQHEHMTIYWCHKFRKKKHKPHLLAYLLSENTAETLSRCLV